MEDVPDGVDASQWCQLVSQWSQPSDKERAKKNTENVKKQTCPHTMGRVSSVRRQNELETYDRLLLWKANRLHKYGTWSSDDARQRWAQACEILRDEGLTPEDSNVEANERVFSLVMGPEHGGRVRVAGFGVTPTKFFYQSTRTPGQSSRGSDIGELHKLKKEFKTFQEKSETFQNEMRAFMEEFRISKSKQRSSEMMLNLIIIWRSFWGTSARKRFVLSRFWRSNCRRRLLKNDGLFIGSSSAMNCVGAVRVVHALGPGHTIVTTSCDGGMRHLIKFYNAQYLTEQQCSSLFTAAQ